MPLTAFPGGVSSFGVPLPGTGIPLTGGSVFWVGNRSGLPAGDGSSPANPFSTLNGALAKCTANAGDVVLVMPGHIETFGVADSISNLVAGTKIIGLGEGNERGTFHWSVAASTVLINVANVTIQNCILNLAGDPALTTAITGSTAGSILVTAAGFTLRGCKINTGVDSDQVITIGILTTADGDDMVIEDCLFYNTVTTADIPDTGALIRLVGADRCIIRRNYISAGFTTVTDPLLDLATTLSKDIQVYDNVFHANSSDSTVCVKNTTVVSTGRFERNLMVVQTDATAVTTVFTGIGVADGADFALLDNFAVNNNNERGLVIGTASA